uniref:DUF4005 domain-containing protein n=1 Tax=Kalanchoe fedtschenkoi TaxID=63787 RepID=A0A7N0UAE1_KALFE
MGKTGGGYGSSSWLSALKRAFKSPSKGSNGTREEGVQEDEDEKRRGKRKWGLWKSTCQETVIHCDGKSGNAVAPSSALKQTKPAAETSNARTSVADVKAEHLIPADVYEEHRQALAVAMASTASAEGAAGSAQAAMGVTRLTHPPLKKYDAAMVIQTAFRGYLARRALRALKGLVKLQALVRGYSVRKRAKMTLHCMQALVRAQTRVHEQRRRLSHEGSRESNSRWESHFVDKKQHASTGSGAEDDWDEPRTMQEVKTKETGLKREKALAYAFSRQMLRSSIDSCASKNEAEERPRYAGPWTANRCDRAGRASCDRLESLKTVHMDTSQSYTAPGSQRSQHQCYQYQLPRQYNGRHSTTSHPHYPAHYKISPLSPRTPVSARIKHIQVNSASPRLQNEMSCAKSQTPNLGLAHFQGIQRHLAPSYMAATASAKARVRSHSVPQLRSETPDGDKGGTVKKRHPFPVEDIDLYCDTNYAVEDPARNLRTTRLPGQHGKQNFTETRTNISSSCTRSNWEELSPPSINNLPILSPYEDYRRNWKIIQ